MSAVPAHCDLAVAASRRNGTTALPDPGVACVKSRLPLRRVNVLAIIGLSFPLFLAGLELNLKALKGRVARISAAYAVSAVLALGGGVLVAQLDSENKPLF